MLTVSLLIEILRTRPRQIFWLVALSQTFLWLLVPSVFYSAPPGDVSYVLAVGRELALDASYGPPLAYWLAGRRAAPRVFALRHAIAAGSAMAFGNTLQMWALTILFTPYVIAIKRLSALFTVLASGHVLKEETGGRLLGAAVMLAGAVMIALARG